MRNRISYGQSYMLASQPPANSDNSTNLSGFKRIQSVSIEWSFNRKRFKHIGTSDFVDDVHVQNANVTVNSDHYYTNGTNEMLMGLNVDGSADAVLNLIRKEGQDRNLYLLLGSGDNQEPLNETVFPNNYDVMGFGNCFLDSYSLAASLGRPISVSSSFSAYNIQVDAYDVTAGKDIPAIDTAIGSPSLDGNKYKILTGNINNTSNLDSLVDAALPPTQIQLNLPTVNVPGFQLGGPESVTNVNISFGIERIDHYGFGSLYPYARKAKMPVLGALSFGAITREFKTGTLHEIISSGENTFDFEFNFRNCNGATGLQVVVEGAVMDNQSFSEGIGGNAQTQLGFTFSMSDTSGLKFSTPPLFLQNPINGVGAELISQATGKSPITYQWNSSSGIISAATSRTYTPLTTENYYVVATNELGSGQSRTAVVII